MLVVSDGKKCVLLEKTVFFDMYLLWLCVLYIGLHICHVVHIHVSRQRRRDSRALIM